MMDELVAALRPFANCVFNDNGDVTYDYSHVEASDYFRAFRVLHSAPAIAGVEPSQEVPAQPQEAREYWQMMYTDLLKRVDAGEFSGKLQPQSAPIPFEPTKEMALAGRKALAIVADRMEEAKLLATSLIDFWQRVGHEPANEIYKAMIEARPPSQEVEDTTEAFVELAQKFAEWRAHFEKQRASGSPYCSWQPEISDVEQMMDLIEKTYGGGHDRRSTNNDD